MKFLHICNNEKFIESYIKFIDNNFFESDHSYIIIGKNRYEIPYTPNITFIDDVKNNYLLISNEIERCEKVFFHGFNNNQLIYLLLIHPKYLKKSYWIIWGADLYEYYKRKNSIKSFIKHLIRKSVFKRIAGLITHIEGDYKLAKEWYSVQGKYYYSFMYPSNMYKDYKVDESSNENSKTYIQVGNSADPSNNHIDILNKLKIYKNDDIEIICPLSYGDNVYAERVIDYGKSIYKDKFTPIMDFMKFDSYLELLSKINIAVFNHRRQQAMGNITTLLGLGKKVYIRNDITTWQFCTDHDLKVYKTNGDLVGLLEKMDEEIKQKNIENVKNQFSEVKLANDWRRIFNA